MCLNIVAKKVERSLQQEHEEALQTLRNLLIGIVQTTFPDLVPLAIERTMVMKDGFVLQNITLKLLAAKTSEEARWILTSASTELE